MKEFKEKLIGNAQMKVENSDTAISVGSGSLPVLGTPIMIALMEKATCKACESLLESGETTVGTQINIVHKRPSAVGEIITAQAVLEQVSDRRLTFSLTAKNGNGDEIGKGTIERFLVNDEEFMKRVNR
ncbi:MAG: thioesterase family protein [Clostridiales bacterium]|nr:thioesterase family protein [Clostridiales bacterium]